MYKLMTSVFILLLTLGVESWAAERAPSKELQVQHFDFSRTLVTDQVLSFNNCFDFNDLHGVYLERIELEVQGLDKESFLELIIDGYSSGRSFDVRRGSDVLVIELGRNIGQVGVDFHEVSLVVRGEVRVERITLVLRVEGSSRPLPPHYPPSPQDDLIIDMQGRYLPGDVDISFSELLAGRGVYTHDYPREVVLELETQSVSSLSLCRAQPYTHECENKILQRGTRQRVSYLVSGPYTIDELSLIARGVVKLNKVIFYF